MLGEGGARLLLRTELALMRERVNPWKGRGSRGHEAGVCLVLCGVRMVLRAGLA